MYTVPEKQLIYKRKIYIRKNQKIGKILCNVMITIKALKVSVTLYALLNILSFATEKSLRKKLYTILF